jgi:hypothetical protein
MTLTSMAKPVRIYARMSIPRAVSQYMAKIGKQGGSAKSEAKAEAVRANGRKGGRPRKDKPKTKTK